MQNFNLNRGTGRGSNIKYNPYAFTEQGIYMLMTVLKGELAVKQSKALIRTFKRMKDYIVKNQWLIGKREFLQKKRNYAIHINIKKYEIKV